MADSARWIAATFPSFGWKYEDWHEAITEAQSATGDLLEAGSLPGTILKEWFEERNWETWQGQPVELYQLLRDRCEEEYSDKLIYFPANPQTLSGALRRIAPELRRDGIDVGTTKRIKVEGKVRRLTTICRVTQGERTVNDVGEKVNALAPQKGVYLEKQGQKVNALASGQRTVNDVWKKIVHPENSINHGVNPQEEGAVNAVNDLFCKLQTKSKKSKNSHSKSAERVSEKDRSRSFTVHPACSSATLREATAGEIPLDVPCVVLKHHRPGYCKTNCWFRPLTTEEEAMVPERCIYQLVKTPVVWPDEVPKGSWAYAGRAM